MFCVDVNLVVPVHWYSFHKLLEFRRHKLRLPLLKRNWFRSKKKNYVNSFSNTWRESSCIESHTFKRQEVIRLYPEFIGMDAYNRIFIYTARFGFKLSSVLFWSLSFDYSCHNSFNIILCLAMYVETHGGTP